VQATKNEKEHLDILDEFVGNGLHDVREIGYRDGAGVKRSWYFVLFSCRFSKVVTYGLKWSLSIKSER